VKLEIFTEYINNTNLLKKFKKNILNFFESFFRFLQFLSALFFMNK